jgi:hypothetical protein
LLSTGSQQNLAPTQGKGIRGARVLLQSLFAPLASKLGHTWGLSCLHSNKVFLITQELF